MTYRFGIQPTPIGTVTDVGGAQSTDANTGVRFLVTLNPVGANTLENPTNLQEGQTYTWQLMQDSSTPVDITFGSNFYFPGGTTPTITQTASAVDIVRATALDDGTGVKLYCEFEADVKAASSVFENDYSVLFDNATGTMSEYLVAGSGSDVDFDGASDVSISVWVRPKSGGTGMTRWILSKMPAARTGYEVWVTSAGRVDIRFQDSGGTYRWIYQSSAGEYLADDAWAHLAIVWDATAETLTLYKNGSVSSTTAVGTGAVGSLSNSEALTIGRSTRYSTTSNYFYGDIDELSFWGKALPSSEVTEIFNNGVAGNLSTHTATGDLTNWYRMGDDASDDLTGGTGQVTDVIGSANLTPQGTSAADKVSQTPVVYVAPWVAGEIGNFGLEFDGNDYVDLPTASVGSSPTSGTMACWVYPHAYAGYEMFFSQGKPTGTTDYLYWSMNASPAKRQRFVFKFGGSQTTWTSSTALTLNQWQHIAVTCDGSSIKFYHNGSEDTTTGSGASWFGDLASGSTKTVMGALWYNGTEAYEFDGVLDEFAIWDTALSLSDIQDLYNKAKAPTDISSSNLQSYYNMEDGSGSTTLADRSGNGNNGTLQFP